MKLFLRTIPAIFTACVLLVSAAAARVDQQLLDELTGVVENPSRTPGELSPIYLEVFAGLAARLESKLADDRSVTEQQLRSMAIYAGRPGSEARRKVYCEAVAKQLEDAAYPATGRQILIESLGQVGDASSVPALVALLGSENAHEADAARMALQPIPGPEAERALLDALKSSSDPVLRLGVIDSLGARGSEGAVADLGALLVAPEARIAAAAAIALGQIGGAAATKALAAARSASTDEEAQRFLEFALVDVANQRGRAGDLEGAGKIFNALGNETKHYSVRAAAVVGVARATPQIADQIVILAVKSTVPRLRSAGISAARSVPSRRLSAGLAAMLPDQPKPVQIQLLEVLAAKRDLAVQEKVVAFLKGTDDPDLQVAAILALGSLGSVQVLELLLEESTSKSMRNREAAMMSLAALKGEDIAQMIEFHAREGKTPEIRAVGVSLFMRNRDRSGLKRMIAFAAEDEPLVSAAALAVLRKEAGDAELRELLGLLEAGNSAVIPVIAAVCGRAENPDFAAREVISAIQSGEKQSAKRHYLDFLQILGASAGLPVVVGFIGKPTPDADAALRSLSRWPDPAALPHMLEALKDPKAERATIGFMVQGIARLLRDSPDLELTSRVRIASEAFEHITGARERQMLLPVIAELPDKSMAEIIHGLLDDRYVKQTAAYAGATLCERLADSEPDAAQSLALALTKGGFNAAITGRAQAVLNKIGGSAPK